MIHNQIMGKNRYHVEWNFAFEGKIKVLNLIDINTPLSEEVSIIDLENEKSKAKRSTTNIIIQNSFPLTTK